MVKTFAALPIVIVGFVMVVGFIVYMMKRPRDESGNYIYEDAVANAPDSGEPENEKSKAAQWLKEKLLKKSM